MSLPENLGRSKDYKTRKIIESTEPLLLEKRGEAAYESLTGLKTAFSSIPEFRKRLPEAARYFSGETEMPTSFEIIPTFLNVGRNEYEISYSKDSVRTISYEAIRIDAKEDLEGKNCKHRSISVYIVKKEKTGQIICGHILHTDSEDQDHLNDKTAISKIEEFTSSLTSSSPSPQG